MDPSIPIQPGQESSLPSTAISTCGQRVKPRKLKAWLLRILVALAIVLVIGELAARYYFGLGDPPLSIADPEIEYLFQPNQTCSRFGNRIHYNAYSMRSDDFPLHKSDSHEVRVLFLGDSVVNGGVLTDQANLATTRLQQRLANELQCRVVVGNASAGSWGPPNELAYVKRWGFFDADVVVLVLSSHDYADAPTFESIVGVSPNLPDHKPLFALQEAVTRYLPMYLPQRERSVGDTGVRHHSSSAMTEDIRLCLDSEAELIRRARNAGVVAVVAQHWARGELTGEMEPGHDLLKETANRQGAIVIQLGPAFAASLNEGLNPYRDALHPNDLGQQLIADTLFPVIKQAISSRTQ